MDRFTVRSKDNATKILEVCEYGTLTHSIYMDHITYTCNMCK